MTENYDDLEIYYNSQNSEFFDHPQFKNISIYSQFDIITIKLHNIEGDLKINFDLFLVFKISLICIKQIP